MATRKRYTKKEKHIALLVLQELNKKTKELDNIMEDWAYLKSDHAKKNKKYADLYWAMCNSNRSYLYEVINTSIKKFGLDPEEAWGK